MSLSCFSKKFIITVLKFKIILTIRLDRLYFLTRQSSQTFLLYFLPTSRRRDADAVHKKISADEFADEPKLLLTSLFLSDTFCSFLWVYKEKSSMSFWTLSHSCGCGSWIWTNDLRVMRFRFSLFYVQKSVFCFKKVIFHNIFSVISCVLKVIFRG